MIIILAFAIATLAFAGMFQGIAGLFAGWRGVMWVAGVTALVAAWLQFDFYSVPFEQRNDRLGLGEILVMGTWVALTECVILVLVSFYKISFSSMEIE